MRSESIRAFSLLAFTLTAVSAHAVDAYSNLVDPYASFGFSVSSSQSLGYQFTSGASGILNSFQIALNNADLSGSNYDFTLSLYTSTSGGKLGSLLGSYTGNTIGQNFGNTSGLATVSVGGPGLNIVSGQEYWLVASSKNDLVWNWTDGSTLQNVYFTNNGAGVYVPNIQGGFSVQVNNAPPAAPSPAACAPFVIGTIASLRRRRR